MKQDFSPFISPILQKRLFLARRGIKKKSWRLTGSKPIRTLQQSGCCLGGVSALFDCLLLFSSALPSLREYHVKMKGKPQNNKDVPSTEKEKRESVCVCIVSIIDLSWAAGKRKKRTRTVTMPIEWRIHIYFPSLYGPISALAHCLCGLLGSCPAACSPDCFNWGTLICVHWPASTITGRSPGMKKKKRRNKEEFHLCS